MSPNHLPDRIENVAALETLLSAPTPDLIHDLTQLDGDLMVLGAAGKMGPTLCLLAQRALAQAELDKRVIAVSRFSDREQERRLQAAGLDTIRADLLNPEALRDLPDAANIIYMVGHKFGTTGQEGLTWALNAFLPGLVMRRFPQSRIVAFSSGNVYPYVPVASGGCGEDTTPAPVGEYAQSVLGRERIMAHFSRAQGTPTLLFRLNYAVEMRYGVLVDIATRVRDGQPIDVSMGHVNVIWQGDANRYALRALALADAPATTLNATGPEILSVRRLAQQIGERLNVQPILVGEEQPTALLNNAQRAHAHFGYPTVPVGAVIRWTADWVSRGGASLNKPTKYDSRTGQF